MNKIMGISLVAMLAVSPFAANAAVGDTVPTVDPANSGLATGPMTQSMPPYALAVEGANDGKVATARYVKGAYNAAIKAINYVDSKVEGRLGTNLQNLTVTGAENISASGTVDLNKNNYNSGTVGRAIVDNANNISTLQSTINDATTGLATKASQTDLNGVDERVQTLESTVGNATSGLVADVAALQSVTNGITAEKIASYDDIVSAVNNETTGLAAHQTAIETLNGNGEGSVAYAVAQEATARDTAIQTAVAEETSAREAAEAGLSSRINSLEGAGYIDKDVNDLTNYTTTSDLESNYATKVGVTATISASTVTVDVLDTWGSDTPTTVEANISGAAYTAE